MMDLCGAPLTPGLNNLEADFLLWRGRLPRAYAHWCIDWDDLPMDADCPEWPCVCEPYFTPSLGLDLREKLIEMFRVEHQNACYPDATDHECDIFANAALKVFAGWLESETNGQNGWNSSNRHAFRTLASTLKDQSHE